MTSGEPILSVRSAKNFARTTIASTFATSLNWKDSPASVTDRCAPSDSRPMTSTIARSPSMTRYRSGAKAPSHA